MQVKNAADFWRQGIGLAAMRSTGGAAMPMTPQRRLEFFAENLGIVASIVSCYARRRPASDCRASTSAANCAAGTGGLTR